ncbi:hypothetical protein [Spongiibacter sp.]|uniref:hypothetical protein n=1 Tax=Spongiibacter sp. TaxID=2024860 RepID=UPI003569D39D
MKKQLLSLALLSVVVTPALADKPAWKGKEMAAEEQKAAHKNAKDMHEDEVDEAEERLKEKKAKKMKALDSDAHRDMDDDDDMGGGHGDAKGLEKQRAMKSEQVQKEAGKGSEQGQKAREQHSRKWWKFWGE